MTTTHDIHDVLRSKPLSELTDDERRSARSLALNILRAEYYGDVRNTTASILDAIKDKEVTDRNELIERIDEECDSAARVLNTGPAIETLLFSDNDSAYAEEYGDEGMVKDGDINWSLLAYCAFRKDVIEQLGAEGVNVDDFAPEEDIDDQDIDAIADKLDAFNADTDTN